MISKVSKMTPAILFAMMWMAVSVLASEVVTGKVKDVNLEARALTLEQIDPVSGRPKMIYLASVLDEDLVDADSLKDLKTDQTVTVQVGNLQNITTTPPPAVPPVAQQVTTVTQVTEVKKSGSNLFEDVEKSSVSIP